MKILCINDQFERGGAGRVAAILFNCLYKKGYDVVVIADIDNWRPIYHIDNNIPVRKIRTRSTSDGIIDKFNKWLRCIIDIRRYIRQEKPDVIIAVQSIMFLCAYIANIGIGIPVIAADHTSFNRKINALIDYVRYHLYKKADGLSVLTWKDYNLLGDEFRNKRVIYNPLSFSPLDRKSSRRKNILCVGRFEVWQIKGFDIIINIWSQICDSYPEWTLEIAGSGLDISRSYIDNLIEARNIHDRVKLLGHIENMKDLYAESSVFALPSRVEGFPMALMEAMSQGCACIAFSLKNATKEMMGPNSGIIVNDNDEESFKTGLCRLLEDDNLRDTFGQNAIDRSGYFSEDKFISDWECFINEII